MDKKRQSLLCILVFNLLFFLFSHQTSFSQSLPDQRFPKEVVQSSLPKLLDFGRGICIPCKKMAPILQELSEEYKGRAIIKIIEIDRERSLHG